MLVLLVAAAATAQLSALALTARPIVPAAVETTFVSAPLPAHTDTSIRPLALVPAPMMRPIDVPLALAPLDTPRARPRAVFYSDAYYTRLTIHRWGSYVELPLFAAEYYLGNRLYTARTLQPTWVRTTHRGVAYGLGALFAVNTVTGAWNLWDSRHDPSSGSLKYVHTALMLASDAGFAWAGTVGSGARNATTATWRRHKNIALGSIAIATVGTGIMWLWNH